MNMAFTSTRICFMVFLLSAIQITFLSTVTGKWIFAYIKLIIHSFTPPFIPRKSYDFLTNEKVVFVVDSTEACKEFDFKKYKKTVLKSLNSDGIPTYATWNNNANKRFIVLDLFHVSTVYKADLFTNTHILASYLWWGYRFPITSGMTLHYLLYRQSESCFCIQLDQEMKDARCVCERGLKITPCARNATPQARSYQLVYESVIHLILQAFTYRAFSSQNFIEISVV